jgi:hypothetical protein
MVAFSVNIAELIVAGGLPRDAPAHYAFQCDWFQERLLRDLFLAGGVPFIPLEDARNGETFGLRIAIVGASLVGLGDAQIDGWWEVFDEGHFSDVYDDLPDSALIERAVQWHEQHCGR